jgi:hypothetical protein
MSKIFSINSMLSEAGIPPEKPTLEHRVAELEKTIAVFGTQFLELAKLVTLTHNIEVIDTKVEVLAQIVQGSLIPQMAECIGKFAAIEAADRQLGKLLEKNDKLPYYENKEITVAYSTVNGPTPDWGDPRNSRKRKN